MKYLILQSFCCRFCSWHCYVWNDDRFNCRAGFAVDGDFYDFPFPVSSLPFKNVREGNRTGGMMKNNGSRAGASPFHGLWTEMRWVMIFQTCQASTRLKARSSGYCGCYGDETYSHGISGSSLYRQYGWHRLIIPATGTNQIASLSMRLDGRRKEYLRVAEQIIVFPVRPSDSMSSASSDNEDTDAALNET